MKASSWIVAIVLCVAVFINYKQKSFWKERYYEQQIFADSLYESNLRLCDSITSLRYINRKSDTLLTRIGK